MPVDLVDVLMPGTWTEIATWSDSRGHGPLPSRPLSLFSSSGKTSELDFQGEMRELNECPGMAHGPPKIW